MTAWHVALAALLLLALVIACGAIYCLACLVAGDDILHEDER